MKPITSQEQKHPAQITLEQINQEIENPLYTHIENAVIDSSRFLEMNIPERVTIMSPFFKQGDYGIIFAPRGVGKSWLSLLMGKALSEGVMIGTHWQCETSRNVLYLDSEMNLHDLQGRCKELRIDSDKFHILNHELLFEKSSDELSLNLADHEQQKAILSYCETKKIDVLILDNLSTAFTGLKENDSDSWEEVSPWMLDMRRRGVSVVLVCHAGRNGQIRGTSKREDAAHWILSLDNMDTIEEENCHEFKSSFTKCRNVLSSDACSLAWKLTHTDKGLLSETRSIDLYDTFIELVNGGITSATEIASELGKGKGTISKWAKKAATHNKIKIQNGRYLPVN